MSDRRIKVFYFFATMAFCFFSVMLVCALVGRLLGWLGLLEIIL